MVAAAHGNDGGGSLRIPASCCGLFGLKPTRARNPVGPGSDIVGALGQDHVLTRSVRDSAALLDATAGPDLGAPYWAPPPVRPFAQEVGADPGRLRIAFTTGTLTGSPLHPDCVDAVRDAAALCAELGHEVTEATPAIDGERIMRAFDMVWAAGCARTLEGLSRSHDRELAPALFEPLTWALHERGRRLSAADYLLALSDLQFASRDMARFLQHHDLWLTPTLGQPPLPIGALAPEPDDPLAGYFHAFDFVPFTPLANASGQPAISVPLYWNGDGLPLGVHFLARFGDEATLFRLAAQLEQARPWATRWPPVSA
jgi:amidase